MPSDEQTFVPNEEWNRTFGLTPTFPSDRTLCSFDEKNEDDEKLLLDLAVAFFQKYKKRVQERTKKGKPGRPAFDGWKEMINPKTGIRFQSHAEYKSYYHIQKTNEHRAKTKARTRSKNNENLSSKENSEISEIEETSIPNSDSEPLAKKQKTVEDVIISTKEVEVQTSPPKDSNQDTFSPSPIRNRKPPSNPPKEVMLFNILLKNKRTPQENQQLELARKEMGNYFCQKR